MPHKAPPPPHLPEPPHPPEMRPDHELQDNPTMHPEHELPGRPFEPRFARTPHRNMLGRATIFGTIFAGVVWVILAIADISVNVILPVIAPIWIGSITLLYAVLRRQ